MHLFTLPLGYRITNTDPEGYRTIVKEIINRRGIQMRRVGWLAGGLVVAGIVAAVNRTGAGDPDKGKENYRDFCVPCHGVSGKGDGPMAANLPTKPRNFTDGASMNALSDEHLFKVIKEGGAAVGKSPTMPAWGKQMTDEEIRDIIAYLRTLAVPPYPGTK